jgi:hypothetical protein
MRICRPGAFLLSTSLVTVSGLVVMNIIGRLTEQRRRARQNSDTQTRLLQIPESRIAGVSALPIELWGVILEYVTVEQLGDARVQCWNLPVILERRLVCCELLRFGSSDDTLIMFRSFRP